MVFIYDASGSPIGMRYRSASFASEVWETYWYENYMNFVRKNYGWIAFVLLMLIIASLVLIVVFEDFLFAFTAAIFFNAWISFSSARKGEKPWYWGIDIGWYFLELVDKTGLAPKVYFIQACIASLVGGLFFIILLVIHIAKLFVAL